jgi:nitrite reductase/ring-hydroxylating ferredoxin subunit
MPFAGCYNLSMAAQPRKNSRPGAGKSKPRSAQRFIVARAEEIAPGQSRKFMLPIGGVDEECFVVNFGGELHAYVNRCRHIPIAMDWVDNHFFEESGRYLICQTHGALFEPKTGECLAGPAGACGKFLFRVPLEVEKGIIYAQAPRDPVEKGF